MDKKTKNPEFYQTVFGKPIVDDYNTIEKFNSIQLKSSLTDNELHSIMTPQAANSKHQQIQQELGFDNLNQIIVSSNGLSADTFDGLAHASDQMMQQNIYNADLQGVTIPSRVTTHNAKTGLYKNVKITKKLTLGDSIDTSYLNHPVELIEQDQSSSCSGGGNKTVLLLRNTQNGTGERMKSIHDAHDLKSVSSLSMPRNSVSNQLGKQIRSRTIQQVKTVPRKRYYNGAGRMNAEAIRVVDTTQENHKMTSLLSRQKKTSANKYYNLHRPYDFAFKFQQDQIQAPEPYKARTKSAFYTIEHPNRIETLNASHMQALETKKAAMKTDDPQIQTTSMIPPDQNGSMLYITPKPGNSSMINVDQVSIYDNQQKSDYGLVLPQEADIQQWAQTLNLQNQNTQQSTGQRFQTINANRLQSGSGLRRPQSHNRYSQKVTFNQTANQSSIYTKADTGSEFLLAETAVSHLMHKAELLPKFTILSSPANKNQSQYLNTQILSTTNNQTIPQGSESAYVITEKGRTMSEVVDNTTIQEDMPMPKSVHGGFMNENHLMSPIRKSGENIKMNQMSSRNKNLHRQNKSQQFNRILHVPNFVQDHSSKNVISPAVSGGVSIPNERLQRFKNSMPSQLFRNIDDKSIEHPPKFYDASVPSFQNTGANSTKNVQTPISVDKIALQTQAFCEFNKQCKPPPVINFGQVIKKDDSITSIISEKDEPVEQNSEPVQKGRIHNKQKPTLNNRFNTGVTNSIRGSIVTTNQTTPQVHHHHRGFSHDIKIKKEEEQPHILFTPGLGNVHHEHKNPKLKQYIHGIQHNIEITDGKVSQMKTNASKIFKYMNKSKSYYVKTLLLGEDQGHCDGIRLRMDPQRYITLQQLNQKFKQIQEDIVDEIKKTKVVKDREKMENKVNRAIKRAEDVEDLKLYGGPACNFVMTKTYVNNWLTKAIKNKDNDVIFEEGQGIEPQMTSGQQLQKKVTILDSNADIIDLRSETESRDDIDSIGFGGRNSRQSSNPPQLNKNVSITSKALKWGDLAVQTQVSGFKTSIGQKSFKSGMGKRAGSIKGGHHHDSAKKGMNKYQKRIKNILNVLGLNQVKHEQKDKLEALITIKGPHKKVLNKLERTLTSPTFIPFQNIYKKNITTQSYLPKIKTIFTSENLDLYNNTEFQNFFRTLCDDSLSIKFSRLNKNTFRDYLKERYSKEIGEKILFFFENQFMNLHRIDFQTFIKIIRDFINMGPEMYKKMVFACLSINNTGRICEHDLFTIVENFKQRNQFFFIKDLLRSKEITRSYNEVIDDSDEVYFQAFHQDIKEIGHSVFLRKKILGIKDITDDEDNVCDTDFQVYQQEADINLKNPTSQDQYEDQLVNEIDYLVGLIIKYHGDAASQRKIIQIIISFNNLGQIKSHLQQFIISQNILQSKKQKEVYEIAINNIDDYKKAQQVTLNSANFLKPPTNIVPCLGSGCNGRSHNKITKCSYLHYEDFVKLVQFNNNGVPIFVEDFIDYISNGQVSVHAIEDHCAHFRDLNTDQTYPGGSINDFIQLKNKQKYGYSKGYMPPYDSAKRQRLRVAHGREEVVHIINAEYYVQDHIEDNEFCGRYMISQQIVKKKKKTDKTSDFNKSQASECPSDEEEHDNHVGHHHDGPRTSMHLINEKEVQDLIDVRKYFGSANFFKIFRAFYKLSNIPEDAQNNPFALYMDEDSCKRNFHVVFSVFNQELATRFYLVFANSFQNYSTVKKVGIIRFFQILQKFFDTTNLNDKSWLKLAFRIFDYDNSGTLGSVDILKIRQSLDSEINEQIYAAFSEVAIKRQLGQNLAKQLKARFTVKKVAGGRESPAKKSNASSPRGSLNSRPTSGMKKKEEEDSRPPTAMNSKIVFEEKCKSDLWSKFVLETYYIRDYFVDIALIKQSKGPGFPDFFDQFTYENEFMPQMLQKYGIKGTSILDFFKSKLLMQFTIKKELDKKPMYYKGYTCINGKVEAQKGKDLMKREITPEMIQIQMILDQLSEIPKPIVAE